MKRVFIAIALAACSIGTTAALAVKRYLVDRGVQGNRLTAVGKGKANPLVECHDKDRARLIQCLEPNRRVEVEQIVVEATPR